MLLKAIKEFNIDPQKSIMIGDKESDMEAGIKANIKERILFHDTDHKEINKNLFLK